MPSPRGMSMVEVWIGLILSCTLPIIFFLPLPFMKKFLAWAAGNFMLMMSDQWGTLRLFATLYGIALACSLSIAIHECGHLVAGLAAGFRCESFRFGRFKIDKGFKVSRYHNMEDPSLGWAKMIPIRSEHLRRRSFAMILAGPSANLLSAWLVIRLWSDQSFISASFIAVSIYMGLGNLLPIQVPGHVNDGQRLWMLLFNPKRSARYFALFSIAEQIKHGVAMESLDSASLKSACAIRDNSVETVQAHLLGYLAIAGKECAKASELLEAALVASGNAPSQLREMLTIYAAHLQATHRQRLDLAALWLAETPEKTVLPDMRAKLEALIANSKHSAIPNDPAQV
ncbi:MAG: hypothetical protein LAO76_06485 [Acidobacteriia bacterium]|nr:hypothetical protein [Terriglobia bacterium]